MAQSMLIVTAETVTDVDDVVEQIFCRSIFSKFRCIYHGSGKWEEFSVLGGVAEIHWCCWYNARMDRRLLEGGERNWNRLTRIFRSWTCCEETESRRRAQKEWKVSKLYQPPVWQAVYRRGTHTNYIRKQRRQLPRTAGNGSKKKKPPWWIFSAIRWEFWNRDREVSTKQST